MNAVTVEKQPSEVVVFRSQLEHMGGQFQAALPAHIPLERFMRVVMTAVQNNPDLLKKATRASLWNAAMKAAQDGLLPDGREGAIVLYGTQAQWMPMIGGLRKKVRNSGEIATWDAYVVHEKDAFEYELGDEPFIRHRPHLEGDPGKVIAAYSVATLKSGEKSREVMSVAAIEKVRAVSKAKNNGPWVTWYEEMCRKTVARRHSKVLPMSTDLDDLIRRDDDLYDFEGSREEAQQDRPRSLSGKLDALAGLPEPEGGARSVPEGASMDIDVHSSEGAAEKPAADFAPNARERGEADVGAAYAAQSGAKPADAHPADEIDPLAIARQRGADDKRAGAKRSATPAEYRAEGREAEAKAWAEGWKAEWEAEQAAKEGAEPAP